MMPVLPISRKRWLLVRNGALGDTILLSTVVQVIRRHDPNGWIELMGVRERVDLLAGNGLADAAVSFDRPGIESLYAENRPLSEEIRDYFASFDTIVFYMSGNHERMRKRLQIREDQVISVHPALPHEEYNEHVTRHYLVALQGILPFPIEPVPRPVIGIEALQGTIGRRTCRGKQGYHFRLALHVGAGSPAKQAPADCFVRVAELFRELMPTSLLVIKGPADNDAIERFLALLPSHHQIEILDNAPLRKLAVTLSICDLFVGNDSGVAHLAAAVLCPTLVLFMITDPVVWSPLGEHVRVLSLKHE